MTRTLIANGQVIDGSGSEPFMADLLMEGSHICEVAAHIPRSAADELIDAGGLVVAPGFIDIHTHYDAQLYWDRTLSSSCHHGVTSVIGGNCGFSLAPYGAEQRPAVMAMLRDLEDMPPEVLDIAMPPALPSFRHYLQTIGQTRPMLNFGAFIGHSTIRIATMGRAAFERAATDEEVSAMAALVADALDAGAMGFATKTLPGARPSPSQFADTAEIVALLQVLGRHGRGTAMFNAGGSFDLEQIYAVQPQIGRPFTWIALLAMPNGSHHERVEIHLRGRRAGVDVHPQVSCRALVARCTMRLPSVFRAPSLTALGAGSLAERRVAYADPSWRERTRTELRGVDRLPMRWDEVTLTGSSTAPGDVGKTLGRLATERGVAPFDLLLDLALADDLATTVVVTYGNGDEAEVAKLLTVEGAVLGLSDGGAHPAQTCDAVLPTDLLGNWVRGRGVMTLHAAIHKLTGEPAALLGLKQRGRIAPGFYADVAVFDPQTIGPGPIRVANDLPAGCERLLADQPDGMHHIFVNGRATRRDQRPQAPESGMLLTPE